MTPKRIQRKRVKGWRMPENTVFVGRPSEFGNPFKVGEKFRNGSLYIAAFKANFEEFSAFSDRDGFLIADKEMAVRCYKRYIRFMSVLNIEKLKGKNLSCWCKEDEPCHADVLLELANK